MSVLHPDLLTADGEGARPVRIVMKDAALADVEAAWARANDFTGKAGQILLVPGADGAIAGALFGAGDAFDPMAVRALAARLPEGLWRLEGLEADDAARAAVAFALGAYRFDRYKARPAGGARLAVDPGLDVAAILRIAAACALAREMVDTPAADMGPLQIETIAREIAEASGASLTVATGDALLEANYPAVHAVGRAAAPHRAPRVIELGWKLDRTDLPVRLVVLVAAVENAISGDAFRPGDILNSRKGLTIEIGNTDAEGRLILADILTRAGEHAPDLTLDFATLTGAARIALGPDLPPLYSEDEALVADLLEASRAVGDPLWPMPLWPGYRAALETEIADVRNDSAAWAQAGSITAALFLQKFAPTSGAWAHMDIFAWNPRAQPGRPEGGEAQGLRACFEMLSRRYPRSPAPR